MTSEALRQRTRIKAANRAARARRERLALGGGILLLAVLLALEGPKMLKSFQGAKPTPAPATTTTQATGSGNTVAASNAADLRTIAKLPAKDPFVQQLAGSGTSASTDTPARPPSVRTSHFVSKDPFMPQLDVAPAVAAAAAPTVAPRVTPTTQPVPSITPIGSGTIVIVASVPVGQGRAAAEKAAAQARAKGLKTVNIARSSAYRTLRTGYYAVYTGPYSTLSSATKELGVVRRAGYASAYTRRLGH
jgi:SPOR domain